MRRRRVKITGIGPVTPAGIGREAFWRGIQESVSRVRPFTKLGEEWGPFIAAEVDDEALRAAVSVDVLPRHLARHSWFGAVGGKMALDDAGISVGDLSPASTAIVTGTSVMDFGGISKGTESVARRGLKGVMPRLIFTASVANVAAGIAETLELACRTMAIQSSCCSGLDAIGRGAEMIATGEADVVIAGGSEAPLFKHPLLEFRAALLTPSTWERADKHCRPFDLWRSTGTIAEGAAMLVLEPEESPRPGYAWIDGYGFASDGAADLCGGLFECMKVAIAEAGVRPDSIDVINAWGPGHRVIDAAETRAIYRLFGHLTPNIATYSIKGAVGNALGGSPGIQVAAAALGLRNELIPPTVNWQYPDPACALNLSGNCRRVTHEHVIINSHGLAGMNAAMVLTRWS